MNQQASPSTQYVYSLSQDILQSIQNSQIALAESILRSQHEAIISLAKSLNQSILDSLSNIWGPIVLQPAHSSLSKIHPPPRAGNPNDISVQRVVLSDLNANEYAISFILRKRQYCDFKFDSSQSAQRIVRSLPTSVKVAEKEIVEINDKLESIDFDAENFRVRIGSQYVQLNPSIEQYELFKLIFSTPEARKTCWEAFDVADAIGLKPDENDLWPQKLYWKIRNLNTTIKRQTKLKSVVLYKGGIVRINEPYSRYR